MDNAPFHKRKDIIEAIKNKGITLIWLPPYSPDLNPIENIWAYAKSFRKRENCEIDYLFNHLLM